MKKTVTVLASATPLRRTLLCGELFLDFSFRRFFAAFMLSTRFRSGRPARFADAFGTPQMRWLQATK